MNEEETQAIGEGDEMTTDEAAAALGFATHLADNLLLPEEEELEGGAGASDVPTSPEMPTGEGDMLDLGQDNESQDTGGVEDFRAEMGDEIKSLRKEMKKMVKDEIGSIKEMIKETLNEEAE